jgi:hypothetical protein
MNNDTFKRTDFISGTLPPNQVVVLAEGAAREWLVHTRAVGLFKSYESLVSIESPSVLVKGIALKLTPRFAKLFEQVEISTLSRSKSWQKARQIVSVIWDSIDIVYSTKLFSKFDQIVQSLTATFIMYYDLVLNGTWDKEFKYHSNYFFSKRLHVELPAEIDTIHKSGHFVIGPLYNLIVRWVMKGGDRAFVMLNTILQGMKRGLPHLDVNRVNESAVKHSQKLSAVRETDSWVLDEVTRTAKEIWSNEVTIKKPDISMKISRNACLERTKAHGGAMGFILDEFERDCGTGVPERHRYLAYMRYHPRVGCWSVYTDCQTDLWVQELRRGVSGGDAESVKKFGEARSEVKFILEPLKVRTITKSSLYSNALYPEVQKQLWSGLQKFKQFRLTGETFTQEHVNWVTGGGEVFFDGVYDMCSGDYSAATDNLHMDCSRAAIAGACKDFVTESLINENMCSQRISYQGAFGEGFVAPNEIDQKNGQLMGSLFSFPILCCINMATFRIAFEKWFKKQFGIARKFSIHELYVLVNGDDILFPTNCDFQSLWESLIGLVGFEKSVGKNFVSNKFLIVNSKMYRFKGYKNGLRDYGFIPIINTSFLTGVKKGQEFMEASDSSYNDRLHNLKGAFRDLELDSLRELGLRDCSFRLHSRVLSRADVLDSKYCQYDLGLTDVFPRRENHSEFRKYCFHHNYLFEEDAPERFQSLPVTFPSDWALERIKLPSLHPNISRSWKTFCKNKKVLPSKVKMLGKRLKGLFKKNKDAQIRRQISGSGLRGNAGIIGQTGQEVICWKGDCTPFDIGKNQLYVGSDLSTSKVNDLFVKDDLILAEVCDEELGLDCWIEITSTQLETLRNKPC